MCDYCGCRDEPPLDELMNEHDRIMGLVRHIVDDPAAVDADGTPLRAELRRLLVMHATKEERALYPLLIDYDELDEPTRAGYEREHEELLARVDSGRFGVEDSNVLAAHIQAEELELFPAARFAFDDDAWNRMTAVSHDLLREFGIEHGHAAQPEIA